MGRGSNRGWLDLLSDTTILLQGAQRNEVWSSGKPEPTPTVRCLLASRAMTSLLGWTWWKGLPFWNTFLSAQSSKDFLQGQKTSLQFQKILRKVEKLGLRAPKSKKLLLGKVGYVSLWLLWEGWKKLQHSYALTKEKANYSVSFRFCDLFECLQREGRLGKKSIYGFWVELLSYFIVRELPNKCGPLRGYKYADIWSLQPSGYLGRSWINWSPWAINFSHRQPASPLYSSMLNK